MNDIRIAQIMGGFAPATTAARITKWGIDKPWYKIHEFAAIDSLSHEQRSDLATNLYEDYCRARGIEIVEMPENIELVMDYISEHKFRFEDRHLFAADRPKLFEKILNAVKCREWGKHNMYISRQRIDITLVANTVFRNLMESDRWGWDDAEYFEQRKAKVFEKAIYKYSDEELFEAVQEYMRSNRYQKLTYNAVGEALRVANNANERPRVKNVLEKLSDPSRTTWAEVVRVSTKDAKGNVVSRYVWAPARRRLNASPKSWKRILQDEIVEFLKSKPDAGTREIRNHCKIAFVAMSMEKVNLAMQTLIDSRAISCTIGARNTHHYRVASRVSQGDANLSSMFSVDIAKVLDASAYAAPPNWD